MLRLSPKEARRLLPTLLKHYQVKRLPRPRTNNPAWEAAMCKRSGIFLPLRTINPLNGTTDRWGKIRRAKEHRGIVAAAVRAAGFGPGTASPIQVTLIRYSPGELDSDGLSAAMKNVRDGVADALGINDRDPRCRWTCRQTKAPGYGVRIQIRIKEK